ncbi:MAG: MotA/TolQ/ExbB proton channel family protein, partial [Spartobacteria bacterium]|nr:MotA/TolQ/ExbB proton channel family protein [Spartobacteria bacterium]
MIEIFHKGGPIMWPLLAVSVVVLAVVIERFLFIVIERKNRDERVVGE